MLSKTDRLVGQVTSGRWILTVIVGICLLKLTWVVSCMLVEGKITLETATYVAIIMSILNTIGMVTVFYFNKDRAGSNGNGMELPPPPPMNLPTPPVPPVK